VLELQFRRSRNTIVFDSLLTLLVDHFGRVLRIMRVLERSLWLRSFSEVASIMIFVVVFS